MQLLRGSESTITALTFSPDGAWLVAGYADGTVRVWGPEGAVKAAFKSTRGAIGAIAFSSGGDRIAVGAGSSLYIGSFPALQWEQESIDTRGVEIFGLAFIPNNDTLAVARGVREAGVRAHEPLKLSSIGEKKVPSTSLETEGYGVLALAASQALRRVIWVTNHRSLRMRDLLRPDTVKIPLAKMATAAALSPDGKFAAINNDWRAAIYDLERRQERYQLQGHKGILTALAYSPDGKFLLTGSWDKTVKLWDAETGLERMSYAWPTERVQAVAYAPDGLRAAAAGQSGTVVVWDMEE